MEMFALDDEIARLETALADSLRAYSLHPQPINSNASAHGAQFSQFPQFQLSQVNDLICLAWYLRQSNTERALLLVTIAEQILQPAHMPPQTAAQSRLWASARARLTLIRAESHWLVSRYDMAQQLAEDAAAIFHSTDDALGLADMHWLMGNIELDRGNAKRRHAERIKAGEQAIRAGDSSRKVIVNVSLGVEALMRNVKTAMEYWPQRLPSLDLPEDQLSVCARAWVYDFWGMAASVRSDFGQAAQYWVHTHEYALRTGQHKRAIIAATNVGDAFNCLNEHQGALDWMERGLELARRHDWPNSIALCQFQTAETMRRLGRLEAAEDLLQSALQTLAEFNISRNYINALSCLAELRLNQRDWPGALAYFKQLQESADLLSHADFQIIALRGQAHALAQLGDTRQAHDFATNSLAQAQLAHNVYSQIDALCVLADIHGIAANHAAPNGASDLPQPTPCLGKSARMHYLLQALQLSNSIEGNTVSAQLLTDLAREYAQHNEFELAWRYADEAATVREKTHNQEATHRAIAMQIQYQSMQTRAESEKAQAEIEHHRQMAAVEAQRAEALQRNSETLERLSAIGQEITAQLDISVVFEALNRHVHGLLDVTTFIILLLSDDGQKLEHAFSRENNHPLEVAAVAVDSPTADSALCLRDRCEVLRDYGPDDPTPNLIPGSLHTLTVLYAPLAIGDQVLGVMSIQSLRRDAYGETERLIFRTLCAYGAIALDNARAYRQLQQAQNHLVAQDKLAADDEPNPH
ncbi:MAG: GAF domain-containing protein [Burkholderiales bacterium]|nr:GAF domain-containing protein [Burkholderiales bacterium]